jgi:hypothetical protein
LAIDIPRRWEFEDGKMLGFMRFSAAVLILLTLYVTKLSGMTLPPAPYITPQMAEIIHAHQSVLDRMNTTGSQGKLPQLTDAQMASLLTEGWQLAGEWAAAWLELHPGATAQELEKIFVDFSQPPSYPEVYDPNLVERFAMKGSSTSIAANVYVVSSVYETYTLAATSSFFVVARDVDGHFRAKWNVKKLAEQHYPSKDEIGRWAFLGSCAYYCGPLVVSKVLRLPSSETGQPRFAIDAFESTNGNTLMAQLSVWQWNGADAEDLLIRHYGVYIDDGRDIQIVGNLLSVPTKEETRSFSSFGCCAEPRGVWTVRVDPAKVQDLGHRYLQPQIQWADQLLAARRSKRQVMAVPSVVAFLQHTEIDANIVDSCQVLGTGRKGAFQISFGEGTKLWFAYRLRNGRPYFTGIRAE